MYWLMGGNVLVLEEKLTFRKLKSPLYSGPIASAAFLFQLLHGPEDGGDILLRKA
jgi:hypothetical protein